MVHTPMPEDLNRLSHYMHLLEGSTRVALYPEAEGIGHNEFTYVAWNGTHVRLKNNTTSESLGVPFSVIDYITVGTSGPIIRLRRQMKYLPHENVLV